MRLCAGLRLCVIFLLLCSAAFAGDLVKDHGGKVGDRSIAARQANDRAFAAAFSQPNADVSWSGTAYVTRSPKLPIAGNLRISGGPGFTIDAAEGPGLYVESGSAGPDVTYKKDIHGLTAIGETAGFDFLYGGKFLSCRDLVGKARNGPGIRAKNLDSMTWDHCYGHGSNGNAWELTECNQNQFVGGLGRDCKQSGFVFRRCAGLAGVLTAESNGLLGLDMEDCSYFSLHIWVEANGPQRESGNKYTQIKLRNCSGIFTGQDHAGDRTDADAFSKALVRNPTNFESFMPFGELFAEGLKVRANGLPKVTSDGATLTIPADGFVRSGYGTLEFTGIPEGKTFTAGDAFFVEMDVEADAAALEFFGERPFFRVGALADNQIKNTGGADFGKNVFPQAKQHVFLGPGRATKNGKGLRLFGGVFDSAGPSKEMKLKASNVKVWRVPVGAN